MLPHLLIIRCFNYQYSTYYFNYKCLGLYSGCDFITIRVTCGWELPGGEVARGGDEGLEVEEETWRAWVESIDEVFF